MAYFIHNKYDKDSIAKVSTTDGINYTYNADNSVIVIDYYGQLQSGNNAYKELDTTSMGISIIDSLVYRVNTGTQTGTEDINNNLSNNEIKTSLFDILMDIVGKIGVPSDLDLSTIFGMINYYFDRGVIKSIQRGSVAAASNSSTYPSATKTITYSAINTAKSIIFVEGIGAYGTSTVQSFNSTSATIQCPTWSETVQGSKMSFTYYYSGGFTWQIVEFY